MKNAIIITSIGVIAWILWADAKDKYLKESIKKPDSNKDKDERNNWSFKFFVFQKFLFFFLIDSLIDKKNKNEYLKSIIWKTVW